METSQQISKVNQLRIGMSQNHAKNYNLFLFFITEKFYVIS